MKQYQAAKRKEAVYEAMLASHKTSWRAGERVKIYKAQVGPWLVLDEQVNNLAYDANHYVQVLKESYAKRLEKAFSKEDFESLFRLEQEGLFDTPLHTIATLMINT